MNTAHLHRVTHESLAFYRDSLVALFLDTEAGSQAEAFYRALGYSKAGEIPDYACGPDSIYRPTALYFKVLAKA